MANEHLILCGPARLTARTKEWHAAPRLTLRIGKGKNDVHLNIEHITERMCTGVPDVVTDLLEIASYVYAADQAVTRGGIREFEYGQHWRRHFRFEIAVRCPALWRRPAVTNVLSEVLGFLGDDSSYEFGFTQHPNPPLLVGYLFDALRAEDAHGFEEVMLFSGGLDSLGGVVRETLHGQRKVALVSHRPVSKLYARQRRLFDALVPLLPDQHLRPLHVAVEVNKGKVHSHDFTQRTRSFLYASLGAVIARLFGLGRIRFYENGVTSLNLPLSPQVLGSRASRTTHPVTLERFQRLFSLLFDCEFSVQNPFQWRTKTDILSEIKASNFAALCALTSSCTHTIAMTTQHTHCGKCTQCVDRRMCALAAGLGDAEDPPSSYASDVLTGPREDEHLTLIERYYGTAFRLLQIKDPIAFTLAYSEISRLLRHAGMAPRLAAEEAFRLYRRHANQICDAMAQFIKAHPEDIVRRRYPPNCMVSIAISRGGMPQRAHPASRTREAMVDESAPLELVLDDSTFEARLGAKPPCFLGNSLEYRLLSYLHANRHRFVSVTELMDKVWGDDRAKLNTIQRTVSNLRRRLKHAGLSAVQIDGSQQGYYRLRVAR
jgi:hypothetical protein